MVHTETSANLSEGVSFVVEGKNDCSLFGGNGHGLERTVKH